MANDEGAQAEVEEALFRSRTGDTPIVAIAIHDGHEVREDVTENIALTDLERLREEDPHTGEWAKVASSWFIARRSRFEVDLNRPKDKAVYRTPEDAWGLEVWKRSPSESLVQRSLEEYDYVYETAREVLSDIERRFGTFVVLDLHTYNHMREGPQGPPADPEGNPEVNIGTGTMRRERWAPLIDRFMKDLSGFDFLGRRLDVRENVKFRGGQFSKWIHETFPDSGCSIAVEFKKFFMNEWTGAPNEIAVSEIRHALGSTLPGIRAELEKINRRDMS